MDCVSNGTVPWSESKATNGYIYCQLLYLLRDMFILARVDVFRKESQGGPGLLSGKEREQNFVCRS